MSSSSLEENIVSENLESRKDEKKEVKFEFLFIDSKKKNHPTCTQNFFIGIVLGYIVKRVWFIKHIFQIKFFKGRAKKKFPGGFYQVMNQNEARFILNLKDDFSARSVRQAHIKLMLLNHPDSGGSTYLASKINEAKDLLTGIADEDLKNSNDNIDDSENPFENCMKKHRKKLKESQRFILSIVYSNRLYYTTEERIELTKQLEEIIERELEQEELVKEEKKEGNHYQMTENKVKEDLDEYLACYLDKNSEFYIKNKEKIENLDFFDEYDELNRWDDSKKKNSLKI